MKYKNNPLNIRYNQRNNWQGQLSPVKGFCTFKSLRYGFRAAFRLLERYELFGVTTVKGIISRWAPPSDNNDTDAYVSYVCNLLDWTPDTVVKELIDRGNLLLAMVRFEQGYYDASWFDTVRDLVNNIEFKNSLKNENQDN